MYESANITDYKFEISNRRITKISKEGWQEVVFMNRKFSDAGCGQISIRILKNPSHIQLAVGAAIESAHLNANLHRDGWNIFTGARAHYEKKATYSSGASLSEGQVVTVRVDVASKTITYLVDGVPAGPPHTMNISDDELLKLRPAVQFYSIGDSAEII